MRNKNANRVGRDRETPDHFTQDICEYNFCANFFDKCEFCHI